MKMDHLATPVALCAYNEITAATVAISTTAMRGELNPGELSIRQTTSAFGSNTCGWIDGNPGEA